MPKVRNLNRIRIQIAKTYESTFVLKVLSYAPSAKTYFRTRLRAVAARIDLNLRHDVVYQVDDALTKFRDLMRSEKFVFRPLRSLF